MKLICGISQMLMAGIQFEKNEKYYLLSRYFPKALSPFFNFKKHFQSGTGHSFQMHQGESMTDCFISME